MNKFTKWLSWNSRGDHAGFNYPGIYAIAYSSSDLSNKPFAWRKEVIYVGMTNAVSGLKGRLQQFDNTIAGKRGHGGADRVRYKHRNYSKLVQKLYVSVSAFKCDPASNRPSDLRTMGDVARFEYQCFAFYVEKFGQLPEFNNKKVALKYSKTVGRGA